MTMAASTGSGVNATSGSTVSTIASTTSAATAPASRELAPAASLADVAEYPAPVGMPWNSPDSRLAAPSASRSRLDDTRSPCLRAKELMEP